MATTQQQHMNTLGVIGIVVAVLNAAFFFLSASYYADKAGLHGDLNSVRIAFAVSSLVVGATAFLASMWPRIVGHGVAAAAGLAVILGAIMSLANGMPPVLGITMLILGTLLPVLAYFSLNHSRVAWSYLSSLLIVFAIVTLFGSPKIRNVLHIGLWYVMMFPGLFVVAAVSLGLVRFDYRADRLSQKSQS